MANAALTSTFTPSQRAAASGEQPITDLMSRALANPDLISLAAGFVDQETLPAEITRAAMRDILADDTEARAVLQYGSTVGLPNLRQALLDRADIDQGTVGIDRVVITAGSNQLLYLIAETLLDPGDIVLCAAPSYLVFLNILGNVGARAVSVETDSRGVVPESLEATLQQLSHSGELERVKAIYLIPYFDNPAGVTMPLDRVAAVVDLAKRWSHHHKIHVLADEAYRELRYSGDHVPSAITTDVDRDTVIVAGTFSKPYSPGVRVGWGILPEHLVESVLALKGNLDFGSPNLNQHLMARVLELGVFDEHVETIRQSYRDKRDAMLEAMHEHLASIPGMNWGHPGGGLYVWATLPDDVDTGPAGRLFDTCVEEGVIYVPGAYFFAPDGQAVQRNTMRLSFGVQSCERIRQGIEALARAIRGDS